MFLCLAGLVVVNQYKTTFFKDPHRKYREGLSQRTMVAMILVLLVQPIVIVG